VGAAAGVCVVSGASESCSSSSSSFSLSELLLSEYLSVTGAGVVGRLSGCSGRSTSSPSFSESPPFDAIF